MVSAFKQLKVYKVELTTKYKLGAMQLFHLLGWTGCNRYFGPGARCIVRPIRYPRLAFTQRNVNGYGQETSVLSHISILDTLRTDCMTIKPTAWVRPSPSPSPSRIGIPDPVQCSSAGRCSPKHFTVLPQGPLPCHLERPWYRGDAPLCLRCVSAPLPLTISRLPVRLQLQKEDPTVAPSHVG